MRSRMIRTTITINVNAIAAVLVLNFMTSDASLKTAVSFGVNQSQQKIIADVDLIAFSFGILIDCVEHFVQCVEVIQIEPHSPGE